MLKRNTPAADEDLMRYCFALAEKAAAQGEYPYAAVVARNGMIVAETINRVARDRDVTRHAELVAIGLAQDALGSTDLSDCTIYANMEPCALCCYAIRESRIGKAVFSMRSPIMGGASRWDILGDRHLSDKMPEVFAPPPLLLQEFLCEEADAMLRRSAPLAWAFMRARGLVARPQQGGVGDAARALVPAHRPGVVKWVMRALRRNVFDRFGRGAGRRPRAGTDVRSSP